MRLVGREAWYDYAHQFTIILRNPRVLIRVLRNGERERATVVCATRNPRLRPVVPVDTDQARVVQLEQVSDCRAGELGGLVRRIISI